MSCAEDHSDAPNLPAWLREMLDGDDPLLASIARETLEERGVEWMMAHEGLLRSQAAFILSL